MQARPRTRARPAAALRHRRTKAASSAGVGKRPSHASAGAAIRRAHRPGTAAGPAVVEGVGTVTFTPLLCSLANPFPATLPQVLSNEPIFDLEVDQNLTTSRCAFKISVAPLTGQTDAYFSLQKLIINMKKAKVPVRGTVAAST